MDKPFFFFYVLFFTSFIILSFFVFTDTHFPSLSTFILPSISASTQGSTHPPSPNSPSNERQIVVVVKSNKTRLEKIEASLCRARYHIRVASQAKNKSSVHDDRDYVPRGPIYRNANAFHRSYLEMEKIFKIYAYQEGEVPLFHGGHCKSIYSSEGIFIHEIEKRNLHTTNDPHQAHVYFLPFSVVNLVQFVYTPYEHDINPMGRVVSDYIDVISHKYPFWNRSTGADHLMLSCHDWGPMMSKFVPHLFNTSIRVLCNANTSEGFNPTKDATLPEINLLRGKIQNPLGGRPPSQRPILAFFAGGRHGHIRHLLLDQWKGKDSDVQVYEKVPKKMSYKAMMQKSRFCLCPSGYEVASPRVVEAIYAECVPVLISDSYIPPFSDVLDWSTFSVQIPVEDIPNIKTILMAISQDQFLRLYKRVKQVQRHFVLNKTHKRFDVLEMTVHSIWLRRLNIHIRD